MKERGFIHFSCFREEDVLKEGIESIRSESVLTGYSTE